MFIYHFTDTEIKDQIKIKFFNSNYYTLNDSRASNLKRAFFFTEPRPPEFRFQGCKFMYKCQVKDQAIYNLQADKKGLIKKYSSIDKILKAIKRLGYKGAIYNLGYNVIILFYNIKIKQAVKNKGA